MLDFCQFPCQYCSERSRPRGSVGGGFQNSHPKKVKSVPRSGISQKSLLRTFRPQDWLFERGAVPTQCRVTPQRADNNLHLPARCHSRGGRDQAAGPSGCWGPSGRTCLVRCWWKKNKTHLIFFCTFARKYYLLEITGGKTQAQNGMQQFISVQFMYFILFRALCVCVFVLGSCSSGC